MSPTKSKSGPPTPGSASDVILKIVTLFLVAIGVLAMFGKVNLPGRKAASLKCRKCGRYRIGKAPCDCGGRKK